MDVLDPVLDPDPEDPADNNKPILVCGELCELLKTLSASFDPLVVSLLQQQREWTHPKGNRVEEQQQ